MRAIKLSLLFLFLSTPLMSDDIFVATYLVFRANFNQFDELSLLDSGKKREDRQPIARTRLQPVKSSDYYIAWISTDTREENSLLVALEQAGSVLKHQSFTIKEVQDPRNGQLYNEVSPISTHNQLPQDWNWDKNDPTVKRSTP